MPPNDAVSILQEQKKIGIILITSGEKERERSPRRRIHCLEKRGVAIISSAVGNRVCLMRGSREKSIHFYILHKYFPSAIFLASL